MTLGGVLEDTPTPPTNLKAASSKLATAPIITALIPWVMFSLFSGDKFLFASYVNAIWLTNDGS
jgi:hypothetical protein